MAALGIGAGTLVHTAAAALGLAGLLLASPLAFDIVRYAGAAYLVWLAWKTLRAPPLGVAGTMPERRSLWRVFGHGAVTNVLNPKVALFFLAFLPQFVDPNAGPVALQVFVLGCSSTCPGRWSTSRSARGRRPRLRSGPEPGDFTYSALCYRNDLRRPGGPAGLWFGAALLSGYPLSFPVVVLPLERTPHLVMTRYS